MEASVQVKRLPSLTGLRAPAAFVVFLSHAAFFGSPLIPGFKIAYLGYVGVSFFFAVSGVVLAWSNPTPTPGIFFWRRFTRIYPLHIVTTVFALLVFTGQHVVPVVAAVFLVQTWWPAWHDAGNNVSWSLCCEAFFYALFPWLVTRLSRSSAAAQWKAGGIFYVSISVVLVAGSLLEFGRYDDPLHWFPVTNAPSFVLGVIVGLRLRAGWRPQLSLRTAWLVTASASALVVAIRIAAAGQSTTGLVVTIMTPAFVILVVAHAAADIRGTPTIFAHRHLVYAGTVSFAFYLIHFMIISFVTHDLGLAPTDAISALAVTILTFCLACGAAAGLHHRVELPVRRLLLARLNRRAT